jgi:ArsR family transcriptional regulator, arsenate/arsenite/antimonite-responsive transcriptional repressor
VSNNAVAERLGATGLKRAERCAPARRRAKRTASHAKVAAVCKALGDENRLLMVHMIAEAGRICVCDLEQGFDLSQPTVSHHLKLLRHAGIIQGEREGTWIYYSLVPGMLELVAEHPIFNR